MKSRMVIFVFLIALGIGFVGAQNNCLADDLTWADTTIDRIIQTETIVQVRLTGETDDGELLTEKLFNIRNESKNAQLAVLLTAFSMNVKVRIAYENPFANTPDIVLVGTIAD